MLSTLDQVEHALGILALTIFGGAGAVAIYSLAADIAPQWRRIARLGAGHVEDHPLPAASVAPLRRDGTSLLRGVEAAAPPASYAAQVWK